LLEIIGVGFGRTGTLSLKHALEHLGYGKCYHFSELLKRKHAKRWFQSINSQPCHWDALFHGYRSTTDWPAAAFYKELFEQYPNAKFILTHRNANDWYASTESTIYKLRTMLPAQLPGFRSIAKLTDQVIWDGTFDGRFTDRSHAIDCYEQHIRDVSNALPSKQLLLFDVRDGWSPLCEFLNVPIPHNISFPNSNDRQVMHRNIRLVQVGKILFVGIVLAVLIALAVK